MKRIFFVLLLCVSLGSLSAQESVKLFNAGNDALKAKDYANALVNYEKAMAVWGDAPKELGMYYNCAICAFQTKDFEKAIKYFDFCATNNFKPEDALFNMLIVYQIQKKTDEYNKLLNDASAKYPENAKFKVEQSKISFAESITHYNSGNNILKAAIDKINTKKFKDANDPGYKAEIAKAKKEFADAIPLLDKTLGLNPANEQAKTVKAVCEKQVKSL